ncbi:sporulation control protein [Natrinema sp. CBA1119]|nr:sporulation control protein [Natrinema sp. CBA1119]
MAAIGIGAPVYVATQALFSAYVYREAESHNRRSPLILAITAFVFGIVAAVMTGSVLLMLVVQALAIALYLGLRLQRGPPAEH